MLDIILKVLVKDLMYLGPWDIVQARYNYRPQGFSQGLSICRSMALVVTVMSGPQNS